MAVSGIATSTDIGVQTARIISARRIELRKVAPVKGTTINFLLEGFDGDVNRIWQSNIFGKPLNIIAEEGLAAKIQSLPEDARGKLQEALQRILNEGNGGLICILL